MAAAVDGTGPRPRLQTVILLAALSALPVLFLAPLFHAPFEPDQGAYATIARGWLHGAIPYRDLWDNKGPLLYLWYAASLWRADDSVVMPRVMAAIVAAACVPFIWVTANALFGRRQADMAAGLFALSFSNVYLQVTANGEIFMLLPFTMGLCAFALGTQRHDVRWFLIAGICASLAVFTRQSALWAFVAYATWLAVLFARQPAERLQLVRDGVALCLGALAGAAPFVIYFAMHGALYDLWYAMFAFNWFWAGTFPLYDKLIPPMLRDPWPLFGGLVFWLLAALGVWQLVKRGDRSAWLVLSFLFFSEVAAQTLGKASPHYAIHLLPAAALAGGVGLTDILERRRQGSRVIYALLGTAVVVTLGGALYAYARPTSADRFLAQYQFQDYADRAVQAPAVASAVERMTAPGDYIYEWGRESEIYFLADRRPATRWLHNRPYAVDPAIVKEILADLDKRQPRVLLLTKEQDQARLGGHNLPPLLEAYLKEHYRYVGRVAYAELYERQAP